MTVRIPPPEQLLRSATKRVARALADQSAVTAGKGAGKVPHTAKKAVAKKGVTKVKAANARVRSAKRA